jgi:5-(carboxyamino)imidazole ribonucleotide mutase
MPGGIPVATVAIGKAGAENAGLLAAQILATQFPLIDEAVLARRERITKLVLEKSDEL